MGHVARIKDTSIDHNKAWLAGHLEAASVLAAKVVESAERQIKVNPSDKVALDVISHVNGAIETMLASALKLYPIPDQRAGANGNG